MKSVLAFFLLAFVSLANAAEPCSYYVDENTSEGYVEQPGVFLTCKNGQCYVPGESEVSLIFTEAGIQDVKTGKSLNCRKKDFAIPDFCLISRSC